MYTTDHQKSRTQIRNWKKFQHFKDRRPPWIKLYRDLLDDVEWHDMKGDDAKRLIEIWLIASEHDGALPDVRNLAFRLRIPDSEVQKLLNRLSHWLIHDDIAPMTARYQDGPPERETESEKEGESESCRVATATPTIVNDPFDNFWKVYPERKGGNPKKPAREKFVGFVGDGIDPAEIIAGAKRFAELMASERKIGTEYVPMAKAWLYQERWKDDAAAAVAKEAKPTRFWVKCGSEQWSAWDAHWRTVRGVDPPSTDRHYRDTGKIERGWWFETENPPPKPESQQAIAA